MNPAALRAELSQLEPGGTLIVNTDTFDERNLTKAGYAANPLTDGSLAGYRVLEVPMTSLTKEAHRPLGVKPRDADRSKNFFALGLISWMYSRPTELDRSSGSPSSFAKNPLVRDANRAAFMAGHTFGETAELFDHPLSRSSRPRSTPGEYTNINGNTALAWGLVAAGQLRQLPLFLGCYPITPASDILHELSKHKNFGVRTLQAEDEIAGIGVGPRRRVRRPPRRHHHERAGRGPQVRDDQPGRQPRAAAARSSTSSAAGPRPACPPRPRRPTSSSPCTAATASRRCRSWPPTARRTASTRPSRRPASRSSTARR